ncbi:MAG: oxidoreductase [Frankiales bacterium]|nr:oxidoreductase [Frankiales bacterium]
MTSVLPRTAPITALPVGWIAEPQLLRGIGSADLVDYRAHRAQSVPARRLSQADLLARLDTAGLAGRGGAGFPLATKIRSVLHEGSRLTPFVVVNACEGEPASAKDTALLRFVPHQVLDGAMICADAIGAERILVAITDHEAQLAVSAAVASRPDAARFEVCPIEARFVAGEAGALVAALSVGSDGRRNTAQAVPPGRRVLPSHRGVDGRPNLLSNAETFGQVAVLVGSSPAPAAASQAATRAPSTTSPRTAARTSTGTRLLTVTGAVRSPGVLEVPDGVPLAQVAEAVGARPSQSVVIGGYHGTWLPAAMLSELTLSAAGLAGVGASPGAGAVIFVGTDTCALAELSRVVGWLAAESARQCGPCSFGLPAIAQGVASLLRATPAGPTATGQLVLSRAGTVTGRGACAHPDGAARFVRSGLAVLAEDVGLHAAYGTCRRRDQGHLALSRSAALSRSLALSEAALSEAALSAAALSAAALSRAGGGGMGMGAHR